MTTGPRWNDLPSLVVYHVLKQLPVRDALNASACCLNWRAGLYFYDGHRKSLTLNIEPEYYEKNMFLWRMYAKYVRQLKLILAGDSEYVEKFIYTILPRLSESKYLIDLTIYATPKYLATETRLGPDTMDQSLFTEKIIYRLRHSICRVQLHGCPYLLPPCLRKDNNDGSFKNLIFVVACSAKYHEAKLGECTPAPAPFRTLQYLSMDYNNLSPESLESLSVARTLRYVVLNVACVPEEGFRNLGPSWRNLVTRVGPALEVTINCISLPPEVIPAVNSLVLVPDIPLSTLRMLFCRTLNLELVLNLVENYRRTLRELHWADGQVKALPQQKTENSSHMQQENNYMMNPFVLLCWHCARLEKLILHGYWHSAQDLLGIARLRASTLTCLQVSALALDGYTQARQPPRGPPPLNFTPVCEADRCPNTFSKVFLHQMKSSLDFTWRPTYWAKLHPALLPAGTSDDRCDYVIQHTAMYVQVFY